MDPLTQIKIQSLMSISNGSPDITIGVIDGPVDLDHPAFKFSKITAARNSQISKCKSASSLACTHGTFVTGILCAQRGSSAPSICPACPLILRPIFMDEPLQNSSSNNNTSRSNDDIINQTLPSSSPAELSNAIVEIVDAGAKIINLSLALSSSSLIVYPELTEAYDYARCHGVIIVVAAGNQGNIGFISLIDNPWIIPVIACNEYGQIAPYSNFGPSSAKRGLMAPGVNITSTAPEGKYRRMSGTSFATAFVTGTIALLWSIFPATPPNKLMYSVLRGVSNNNRNRTIIPPLLNAEESFRIMKVIS